MAYDLAINATTEPLPTIHTTTLAPALKQVREAIRQTANVDLHMKQPGTSCSSARNGQNNGRPELRLQGPDRETYLPLGGRTEQKTANAE